MATDLSGFILDCAHWGVQDPAQLAFVDPPPKAAVAEARALLQMLGALDVHGQLTDDGKRIRAMALPPRLAAMVVHASAEGSGLDAAFLAVMITEQGLGGSAVDLEERLRHFKTEKSARAQASRSLAKRILNSTGAQSLLPVPSLPGPLLLHAYPDRIALQRGGRGRFVMANGRGAELDVTERLAGAQMVVIADLTGHAARSRILAAAEIDRSDIDTHLRGAIVTEEQCLFDRSSQQVRARRVTRLGSLVFDESPIARPTGDRSARALAEGVSLLGIGALAMPKDVAQLRDRIGFLHRILGEPWPDVSDDALIARLEDWFVPFQADTRGFADISAASLSNGLMTLVDSRLQRDLAIFAPTHFEAPTGQRHPIRYEGDEPVLSIRVQELYGMTAHPKIGGGQMPLLLELVSPAHRLIQTTRNLPGFWAGSWKDVRADMRGRYPRHLWPENPAQALPTTRAKPRGT